MSHFRRVHCAAILFSWLLLNACATREPLGRYFVLTSEPSPGEPNGSQSVHGARIFIRRVDIPGYLLSTKLVSRHADNQVEYATTAQWAEPLDQGIAAAVANAIDHTARATVVGAPGGGVPPARDYDLKIDLERFEGDDKGDVVLGATWSLFLPESSTPVMTRRSRFVQTGWKYGDYPALAHLLGADVTELGHVIARAVR